MRLSFVRQCVQRENWGLKQKLDEAREKIVALMGNLPKEELFAKQKPPGRYVIMDMQDNEKTQVTLRLMK